MTIQRERPRAGWGPHLMAGLGLAIIVAAMHWPLILHLRTHIIGWVGTDSFEVLYQLRWMQSALFERHISPWYVPEMYWPVGWHIASGAQPSWWLALLALPARWLGEVTTFNLTGLLALTLGGWGAYLAAYYATRDRWASLLAGIIYAAAPTLTYRLRGHVHMLLAAQMLPYLFLTLQWALAAQSQTRAARRAILAGLCMGLAILGHWYFLFIATLPFLPVLLLAERGAPWRRRLVVAAVVGAVAFLLVAPAAWLSYRARLAMFGGNPVFSLMDADFFSLSPEHLLAPNPFHPLWGPTTQRLFNVYGEHDIVSLGITAFILALIGLAARGATSARRASRRVLVGLCATALVLALGTTLHWRDHFVLLPTLPWTGWLLARARAATGMDLQRLPVPLPGLLLYFALPFYRSMRVVGRYGISLILGVGQLAAWGLHLARVRLRRGWAAALVILCVLLVLAESWVAPYVSLYTGERELIPVSVNQRPAVTAWLQALPPETAIIEYPRGRIDLMAMYNQPFHGLRLVNGYMSQPPRHLTEQDAVLGEYPSAASLPLLRTWGVRYVLVTGPAGAEGEALLARLRAVPGLRPVRTFDEGVLGLARTFILEVAP